MIKKCMANYIAIVGDLVWLFSPVVPSGQSRKLHHPWSGPYRVIAKLSETDYHVKKITGRKTIRVVHFNWLKHCDPATRFENLRPHSSSIPAIPVHLQTEPDVFSQEMEPLDVDSDDIRLPSSPPQAPSPVRRYPARLHALYIHH